MNLIDPATDAIRAAPGDLEITHKATIQTSILLLYNARGIQENECL